jgi:hypothetical protein
LLKIGQGSYSPKMIEKYESKCFSHRDDFYSRSDSGKFHILAEGSWEESLRHVIKMFNFGHVQGGHVKAVNPAADGLNPSSFSVRIVYKFDTRIIK